MKILIIANSESVHTSRFANEFVKQGHEVLLLSATPYLGRVVTYTHVKHIQFFKLITNSVLRIFKKSIKGHNPENSKSYHPLNFLILFRMVYLFFFINRLLKKEGVDAVFATNLTTNGLFAARIKKDVKKVCTTLGCDLNYNENAFNFSITNNKYVYKYVDKKLSYILTGEEKFYHDFFENDKIFMNPHKIEYFFGLGVDTDLFNPDFKDASLKKQFYNLTSTDILAVCFRQPRPSLAFSDILDFLPKIIEKHSNFYFAIGTGGREYPELIELVKKHNLGKHVLFMDNVPYEKLYLYLAQADIFIDPVNIKRNPEITSSGISGATLESMACGLIPVIGRRPGLDIYFTDKLNELIYEDMEANFVDYVEKAINNIRNIELKNNIRNIVIEKSSWNTNVSRILKLLNS